MKNRFFLALSTGLAMTLLSSPLVTSAAFRDVPDNHPYKAAIDFVQSEGIVSGYPDGTFQPDRKLNRAEFTKIIMASRFGSTEIETCSNSGGFYKQVIFKDVEPTVWFEKYVCLGKKNGVIGGYPDGTFKPTQTINFAEAAKIMVESYGLNLQPGDPWFMPYLNALEERNAVPKSLANISDSITRATKEITRAEMAEIIHLIGISDDKVVSDDGNFVLSVPENALPAGVSRETISIRKLEQAEQPVEEINGAPMLFYDLQPDGLQFREAVTFELNTPTVGNAIPLVFIVTEKDFEMLPEPAIEINQERQRASLSGKLSHFSQLALGYVDLFDVQVNEIAEQTVGEPFSVTAVIHRFNVPQTFLQHATGITISLQNPWTVSGGFFQQKLGLLTPPAMVDIPKLQLQSGPQTLTVNKNFTCLEPSSSAQLQYQAVLGWSYEKKNGSQTNTVARDSIIATKSNSFTCKPSNSLPATPSPTTPGYKVINGRFFVEVSGSESLQSKCSQFGKSALSYPGSSDMDARSFYSEYPQETSVNGGSLWYTCKKGSPQSSASASQLACRGTNYDVIRTCSICNKNLTNESTVGDFVTSAIGECSDPVVSTPPPSDTTNPDPNNLQCVGAHLKAPENGGVPVQVLKVQNGHCFPDPDEQLGPLHGPDFCPEDHYHGGPAYSLTGEQFTDPLSGMSPPECGFGRVSQTSRATIYVDAQQLNEVRSMYGTEPSPSPPPAPEPVYYSVTAIEKFVMSDTCGHDPFIGLSSSMTFIVDNFDLIITGSTSSGSFTLTGSIDGSGNFSATGAATVAGFSGTSISMSGRVDGSTTSTIIFGANGTLPDCPADHPISYGVILATS